MPEKIAARALVLAPDGRDAAVAGALLGELGHAYLVCSDFPALVRSLGDDVSIVIVTEDIVRAADLRHFAAWIAGQPSWSDLPVIVLTRHGGGPERNPEARRFAELLGNVSFVERPFHPTTFASLVRTACKGRQRQYDARARIEHLGKVERDLREANERLEQRVSERTAELREAHETVVAEMAQREQAETALRQAQKMEAVGQITGGVAHDFNNLLMAVMSNLDLLRKHAEGDARAGRLIDAAMQGARRGAALTQRLLAFARRQDLQIASIDLVDLVRGMGDLLLRSVGSAVELRTDLPVRIPPVLADANQLELALLNLVVNARDAIQDGGTIAIVLDTIAAEGDAELAKGTYVRLTVADTGQGMDAETLQKATEPFFTTKGLGKGTGLGLSMIHGLALQLDGALRLSSAPGKGTRAEIWLPASDAAPVVAAAQPEPQAVGATPRITILVVDDDALIAMSTTSMLEDLGHSAIEAYSAKEALELLRQQSDIDVMITDFSMPRMTGAQLAREARLIRPELPILLATGYAELPPGGDIDLPRLAKPYGQDQLAAELAKLLAVVG